MAVAGQLYVSAELARKTTRRLARGLESVALLLQAVVLALSGTVDVPSDRGRLILYTLAFVHLVAAVIVRWREGPFSRGGIWLGVWAAMIVIMPLVMANLVSPASYGAFQTGVQLFGYSLSPLLIFAFYPWTTPRWASYRHWLEAGIVLVVAVEPWLIMMRIYGGQLTRDHYTCIAVSAGWNLVAFAGGKAIGRMCRTAAESQIEMQQENYHEFFNFLHSHVETAVAVVQRLGGDSDQVARRLNDLKRIILERRMEMLLVSERVPLADIFKESMRFFGDDLVVQASPRVGRLTVRRPVGILLTRALGDLLKNAVDHGGGSVRIDFTIRNDLAVLDVIDEGEGFPSSVLDDPATSLFRLRRAARDLNGDLVKISHDRVGSHVQLSVPLHGSDALD